MPLGILPASDEYMGLDAFDFWDAKYLNVFKDAIFVNNHLRYVFEHGGLFNDPDIIVFSVVVVLCEF